MSPWEWPLGTMIFSRNLFISLYSHVDLSTKNFVICYIDLVLRKKVYTGGKYHQRYHHCHQPSVRSRKKRCELMVKVIFRPITQSSALQHWFFLCILWLSWWRYPLLSYSGLNIWSNLWNLFFLLSPPQSNQCSSPIESLPVLLFSIPTVITLTQALIISPLQYWRSYQLLSLFLAYHLPHPFSMCCHIYSPFILHGTPPLWTF